MVKNIGAYALIATAFLFIGIMLGIFLGLGTDGSAIQLIPTDLKIIDGPSAHSAYRDTVTGKVNINTASKEELMTIPGIGEKTAQNILSHRQKYGKFYSVDELLKISGIGEQALQKMRPYITVGG